MNILVYTAHTLWKPHFETELEIIQCHLDNGDKVLHLHCDGSQLICDANSYHNCAVCHECIEVRRAGLSFLSPRVPTKSYLHLTRANRLELARLPRRFSSLADFRNFKIDNFDIGYACLSSIISLTRNPVPDLVMLGEMVPKFLVASLSVYRSMQNFLDRNQVDRVYVFNGRFASCRAVIRACESRNSDYYVHERGCDINHYALYKNSNPCVIAYSEAEIRRSWDSSADNPKYLETANKFYHDRANGVIQSWHSFTEGQRDGKLPLKWIPSQKNIVIFSSSEDEFASVGAEWQNPIYANQLDGISKILESLKIQAPDIHVYLRIHPNLRNVNNAETKALRRLQAENLTVIMPEDSVSTYALLRHANKVLTFGSTVGIEAVYWGTPSILAGRSLYQNLGGTYIPSSHDELMEMLKTNLAPGDKTGALMYGYYLNTFGVPFRYFKPIGVGDGMFKGMHIVPPPVKTGLRLPYIRHRVQLARSMLFILKSRIQVLGWRAFPWYCKNNKIIK